ncbi:MFS transporter [Natrinema zhouii]|uniref:MFS transporter n=1 Tax=Natrinema zhouii TaxID=1710539 RepID=UPI001CF7D2B2|nr:MFS transporter [Natrinema zhouii]QLK27770.2 MFS transporter [Natrinema zhouii]
MAHPIRTIKRYAKETTDDLWAGGRGWILLAVGAGWALSIGVRFVYPALVPYFQDDFGIGLTTTGLLLTLLWGAYAIGHVPGGFLGDRIGEGTVVVLSTLISAGTVLVVATAINVWMLFAGTIVFGLATALYGPTRFTIFTDIYPNRAGSAIGLTMAAGNLGNTVFPVAAAVIASYTTWRYGIGSFSPLFLGVAVGLWMAVPNRTSGGGSAVDELSSDTLARIRSGITRESIPIVVAIQVTASFVIQGFSSFYPTYLTVTKGFSPAVAATLFGLFFAVGAVIQPFSGTMLDRLGARPTLVLYFGGCVAGLWLLPFVDGLVPLVAATVLISSWNGCGVVTQTYIADSLPDDMQGTGLGTLKAGWMVVGATSPLLIGTLADYGSFDHGFLLLASVGTVGLLLSITRL